MKDLVHIERHTDVAVVTLNRPEARNALNVALAQATCDAFESCADARAIVLTGTDPAFCAGLDLRDLGVENLSDLPRFNDAVRQCPVPVVAAVNGPAVTGGFELALGCDFIVASEHARFADTHARVGVYPGPVLVDLPRRVGIAWARELSLTGNFINAETALRIGLVNHVVLHADLVPYAVELAQAIAEQDPIMIATMRKDWDATFGLPLADAHAIHREIAVSSGFGRSTSSTLAEHRVAVIERARVQGSS